MHRRSSARCALLYMTMPCCCCCFRTSNKNLYSRSVGGFSSEKKIKLLSYSELAEVGRSNKIGQGGFGTVYKGRVRSGRDVKAKVLSAYSRQGIKDRDRCHREPPRARGLLRGGKRQDSGMAYEYLEKSSLDRALLDRL